MVNQGLTYDPILLNFYRSIAEKCGLLQEDIEFIFGIQESPIIQLGNVPTRISFYLQDEHEVSFDRELEGNAISISAESQRNKTTSLLSIATLLGYSWSDKQNHEFLDDEEFVKKGQSLRRSLEEGRREASVELTRDGRRLKVRMAAGRATVECQYPGYSDQHPFDLRREFPGFERYLQELVDVQLVSKGRNFIRRIEADVLDEIARLGKVLRENSEQAFVRATTRSRSLAVQIHRPTDYASVEELKDKITKAEQEIEQKKVERKPYATGQNTVNGIIDSLIQLGSEIDKVRELYRLEQQLTVLEDIERRQTTEKELVAQKEKGIAVLEQELKDLCERKDTLESAFDILRMDIVNLIDNRQIKSSPEIKTLQERIELFDVNGVCLMYVKNLEPISLEVYQALIEAIETTVSQNVAIVPLTDNICDTDSLLQQLRSGLAKTKNLVALNAIISKFMEYLEKHGLSLNLTPNDYEAIQAAILEHEEDLHSERAELKTAMETEVVGSKAEKLQEIRKQIQQVELSFSEETKLIKSEVEDTIATLDKALKLELNKIWASDGLEYLQREQQGIQAYSRDLLLKINKLVEDVEAWRLELQRGGTEQVGGIDAGEANRIKDVFQNNITYIVGMAETMLKNEDLTLYRQTLKEVGLEEAFQEAIDRVITRRCRYYYKNSGDQCLPIPLDEVIFHRKGRDVAEFHAEGLVLNPAALSGGTQSVMTVRSLASKPSSKPFGVVLLVDEWGDVEQIGQPLYAELKQMQTILLAAFVKVEQYPVLTIKSIN